MNDDPDDPDDFNTTGDGSDPGQPEGKRWRYARERSARFWKRQTLADARKDGKQIDMVDLGLLPLSNRLPVAPTLQADPLSPFSDLLRFIEDFRRTGYPDREWARHLAERLAVIDRSGRDPPTSGDWRRAAMEFCQAVGYGFDEPSDDLPDIPTKPVNGATEGKTP